MDVMDVKVVRGEHKVKLRGGANEEEDDPPRRLGLFEIYGILLVSKHPAQCCQIFLCTTYQNGKIYQFRANVN
jgi:hypothetical protein